MAFAGVVYWEIGGAEGGEEEADCRDYGEGGGDGVALGRKVAAGRAEISLHVDYKEGGCRGVEGGIVWPGVGLGGGDLGPLVGRNNCL